MGAANDNYKQVNISVKGCLRSQMNVFDRNILPKLEEGEIQWAETAFLNILRL